MLTGNELVRILVRTDGKDACLDFQACDGGRWRQVMSFGGRAHDSVKPKTSEWRSPIRLKSPQIRTKKGVTVLKLSERNDEIKMDFNFSVKKGEKWIGVETVCTFERNKILKSLFCNFFFLPDGKFYRQYEPFRYLWIPTLRKKDGHVIADQIFRSPAVVLCTESIAAALVPDLEYLKSNRVMTTCLDAGFAEFGAEKVPQIGFGFQNYAPDGHTYFEAAPYERHRVKGGTVIKLKFHLYIAAVAPDQALRDVVGFLWDRYGKIEAVRLEPQTVPFDRYAEYGTDFALKRGRIWREFRLDDRTCGGTMMMTFAGKHYPAVMKADRTRNYLRHTKIQQKLHELIVDFLLSSSVLNDALEFYIHNFRMSAPPVVPLQSWFNNMRTAFGMFWFGRRRGNKYYMERSRQIKNLALAAPVQQGVFSTVCCAASDEVFWYEGTRAFEFVHEYHLPDNATTCLWMLRWHEELERDRLLFGKCVDFGDFLLKVQKGDGSIPSWVSVSGGRVRPSPVLERAAPTAASALFLARLARATKRKKYLKAATLAGNFIRDNVIPGDL
ncbi:MAG: hypothetical protein AB1546_12540, partial [bacterium]